MRKSAESRAKSHKQSNLARVIKIQPKPIKAMPDVSMPAVWSFIKETRSELTWTAKHLADSLRVSHSEAEQVLTILELQGYVKRANKDEWMTTIDGEAVSDSKKPHFSLEWVDKTIAELTQRINAVNKDRNAAFHVSNAVAFGHVPNARDRNWILLRRFESRAA